MSRPRHAQGLLPLAPPEGQRIRDALGRLGARIRLLERRLEDYPAGVYQLSAPRLWVPLGGEEAAAGRLTAQAASLLLRLRALGQEHPGADRAWQDTATRLDALTPRDAWVGW